MLRWSRASLLGLVVMATGLIAHVSAAGLVPGAGATVALYGICVAGCAAFLGREASTLRLVALMVGGQAFVHSGLAALAGHQGDPGASAASAATSVPQAEIVAWNPRSGQSYAAWQEQNFPHGTAGEIALPGWMTHAVSDLMAHPAMALAHVLAAVAVGAWLAVGERALWAVIQIASTSALQLASTVRLQLGGLPAVLLEGLRWLPQPTTYLGPAPQLPVWSRGPVKRGPPQVLPAR